MKKILALVLCLCTLFPVLVACGEADPTVTPVGTTAGATSTLTTPTPTLGATTPAGTTLLPTPTPGAAPSTKDTVTEEGIVIPLFAGTYEVKHTSSGAVIASNDRGEVKNDGKNPYVSIDWKLQDGAPLYRIAIFETETLTDSNTKETFTNYETNKNICVNGTTITTDRYALDNDKNLWVLTKNDDGTYYITSFIKSDSYLTMVDGQLKLAQLSKGKDPSAYKWTITNKSLDNPYYLEYKSEDRHVLVRLPLDVHDKKNYESIKILGEGKKPFTPTPETMIEYANGIMDIKDTYTDLCGFEPYNIIILHAYNYQKYMAYVVADFNRNFVWANASNGKNGPSWYYRDLQEVQYRKDHLDLKDCGFVMLHEIGHMYDHHRKWNFESEMLADLKAAYFLNKHPEYVAAPAEFEYDEYMNGETVAEGYGKLSGGKMQASADGADANYSIYRNAQINTEIVEKLGWEALRSTFRWFNLDPEGINWSSKCKGDMVDMFYAKLQEYSGKDPLAMYDKVELKEVWKRIDSNHEQHLADRG